MWKKRAIFFLAVSLLLINPGRRWVNYSEEKTETPNLKILSFNIKAAQAGRAEMYDYLESSGADVILAQEFGNEFNLPTYKHRTDAAAYVATNSKTKILKVQNIDIGKNGSALYTDVEINGTIIRIFNIYLNPFSFEKEELKPSEDLDVNKSKLAHIRRRLLPTFKIHQQEIKLIRRAIEESPYPVIVAGDFNAVPNSYEYYELGKGLTDAFVEAGSGNASSFHDIKFPLRIDFIFCSPEIKALRYKVDRSVHLSDHYPVIAEFLVE